MQRILTELTRQVGVRGAAAVTRDGMLIASALSAEVDEDTVAALGASLVLSTLRALGRLGMTEADRLLIIGSRGRIVLVDAGCAFLLVLTDVGINLDLTLLDITGAAYKLRKASRLEV